MKRRLISVVVSIVLTLCAIPLNLFSASAICCCKDGFDKTKYTLSGDMAKDVATIAKSQNGRSQSQIGYTEGWCDEFVADCIENAGGGSDIVEHGGDVGDFLKRMKNKGATEVSTPQAGDLVFYYRESTKSYPHVAIMLDSTNSAHGNIWLKGYGQVYCMSYKSYGDGNGHSIGSGLKAVFVRPAYKGYKVHNDCIDMTTGNYYLKNQSTKTYMQAAGASNAAKISLAAKKDTSAFQFNLTGSKSAGYYLATKLNTGYVVNPYSDTPANGTAINIYKKDSSGTQLWEFDKSGSGYIIHLKSNLNLCLTADGTSVVLKNKTNAANQIWILEDVNTTTTVKFHRNLNSDDTTSVTETFTTGVSNQKFGYKTDGTGRYSEMNDASVGFGKWSNPGYKMLGWSKDKNAKTASWKTYSSVIDSWISNNAPSVDLYAVWEKSILRGDANNDGEVNVTDAVILQNWLLGSGDLPNWQNVDLCEDGVIDVFDMVLMRKLIIEK